MKVTRSSYQRYESAALASFAMKSAESKGRRYPEKEHEIRTIYQRDRDRILFSTAFRRLQYKTQVFVNHEGDHFRTRLTHTLETSQIAKTIGRALGLNEDLIEAVSLGHDLGHGPFGHAGEWALREMMKNHGGFEHNVQGLRIVEELEDSYPGFRGLNLSWETLEGFKKHPERFYRKRESRFRTLEADVVDYADEIAYSSHDLDDGLRSGLITEEQVAGLKIWQRVARHGGQKRKKIPPAKRKYVFIRLIINRLVMDLIENTRRHIRAWGIENTQDLQKIKRKIVDFTDDIKLEHTQLKTFLHRALYQHPYVVRMTDKGQRFVKALFQAYLHKPRLLPHEPLIRADTEGIHRVICDYLAGMTDRFAVEEYKKLFEPYEKLT